MNKKKKITWICNALYFHDKVMCLSTLNTVQEYRIAFDYMLDAFLMRYNCKLNSPVIVDDMTIVCSEADFLIIQLTEPGAISYITH